MLPAAWLSHCCRFTCFACTLRGYHAGGGATCRQQHWKIAQHLQQALPLSHDFVALAEALHSFTLHRSHQHEQVGGHPATQQA